MFKTAQIVKLAFINVFALMMFWAVPSYAEFPSTPASLEYCDADRSPCTTNKNSGCSQLGTISWASSNTTRNNLCTSNGGTLSGCGSSYDYRNVCYVAPASSVSSCPANATKSLTNTCTCNSGYSEFDDKTGSLKCTKNDGSETCNYYDISNNPASCPQRCTENYPLSTQQFSHTGDFKCTNSPAANDCPFGYDEDYDVGLSNSTKRYKCNPPPISACSILKAVLGINCTEPPTDSCGDSNWGIQFDNDVQCGNGGKESADDFCANPKNKCIKANLDPANTNSNTNPNGTPKQNSSNPAPLNADTDNDPEITCGATDCFADDDWDFTPDDPWVTSNDGDAESNDEVECNFQLNQCRPSSGLPDAEPIYIRPQDGGNAQTNNTPANTNGQSSSTATSNGSAMPSNNDGTPHTAGQGYASGSGDNGSGNAGNAGGDNGGGDNGGGDNGGGDNGGGDTTNNSGDCDKEPQKCAILTNILETLSGDGVDGDTLIAQLGTHGDEVLSDFQADANELVQDFLNSDLMANDFISAFTDSPNPFTPLQEIADTGACALPLNIMGNTYSLDMCPYMQHIHPAIAFGTFILLLFGIREIFLEKETN